MYKKLLFLLILFLTLFIQFNNNVEALTLVQTFTTTFVPQQAYEVDSLGNATFVNKFMLMSQCILIPEEAKTFSIEPTRQLVNEFGLRYTTTASGLEIYSEIRYYSDEQCDDIDQIFGFGLTPDQQTFFDNDSDFDFAKKSYVFELGLPNVPVGNLTKQVALQVVYATSINYTSSTPNFYQLSGGASNALTVAVNNESLMSFDTPNIVRFNNGNQIIEKYFIDRLPIQPLPTKTNHDFLYYATQDGTIVRNRGYFNPEYLDNGLLNLYAVFEKNFTSGQPTTAWIPPAINNPIGTILFNLGYYNITGFVFIYTLLILISSVALWYYGMNSFVTLISNILITAVFMFFGYLPFFVSIIMILLFLLLIIGINKGGLFSE
jgi:hypothetical protein